MSLKTNAPQRGRIKIRALSANITLTPEDTGTTFLLDAVGEDIIIPTPVGNRGVHYRFVMNAKCITSNWTITSGGTDLIHGQIASGAGDDVDTITAGTGIELISFINTAADEGDHVNIFSTGVFWMATGACHLVENITFTGE